jgi:predicted NBD/HSP70 family sugar kinase
MIKAALEVGGTFINVALGDEQYNITNKVTIDTKDPDETIQ